MALTRPRARSAATSGSPAPAQGVGASAITVKGERATAEQRRVIDGVLGEAARLGAAQRVMVACVMAITQESAARSLGHGDAAGPDSRGPFQQRTAWGPASERMDPAGSARLFLTVDKGPGVRGWRPVHGGLSVAPGDLSAAIQAVQRSAYPRAYAQWEAEATRTVEAWRGSDGFGAAEGPAARRYEFTRGERGGERETSWDASGRLAEEVGWLRWAAGNVLHFVSEQELRRAAPSVRITGDEPWLLSLPEWEWGVARPIAELTLRVAADRWGVMPGGVVVMATGGPEDGRWVVGGVSGARLDSPEVEVRLRRPRALQPEPAAEQGEAEGGGTGDGSPQARLLEACRAMSGSHPYLLGGGHGPALDSIQSGSPLDCSSATSKALRDAGMFPGSTAITSGVFASSWGLPGKGRTFTVWANAGHVFVEFHDAPGGWRRFDTSPWGDGGSGARLRRTARGDTGRFTARHWEGA